MLIILEGPDLAGKSTLAAEIQLYTAIRFTRETSTLLHRGPPSAHPLHEYITPLLDYQPGLGQHLIIDRWHLGEVVYPRVLGRSTQMNDGVRRYIDAFLQSRGALVVHVDATDDVLTDRYKRRGDPVQSLDTVLRAAKEFREVVKTNTLPVSRLTDVEAIVECAFERQQLAVLSMFSSLKTYVGSLRPLTIYVGDVRACDGLDCPHTPPHDRRFPAFGPFPSTSGDFLMRCLHDQFEIGIINANDVDSNFIELLRDIDVVALGRRASLALKENRIPHTVVPHPQYVRRFHYHELNKYRELLLLRDGEDHGAWKS